MLLLLLWLRGQATVSGRGGGREGAGPSARVGAGGRGPRRPVVEGHERDGASLARHGRTDCEQRGARDRAHHRAIGTYVRGANCLIAKQEGQRSPHAHNNES